MAITTTWSVNDMTHNDADGGVIVEPLKEQTDEQV